MTRHCLAPTCLHVIGAFDLAFQRGPLPRQTAAVCLWPDSDDRQAAARLRSTLWRLPAPEGRRLVSTDAGQLQLAAHVAVEAHLGEGNNSEALRQFDSVRRLLRDELGIAPAPATRALVADLLGRPLDLSGGPRAARARRTA